MTAPATDADRTPDIGTAFARTGVEALLAGLDAELIGLTPVKTRIREIAALLLVEKLRAEVGLSAGPPSLHMSFTGNPGTGKTTIALRMAEILHRLGYVRKGHLVAVTRDDLVGQFIGHTAPKTREVLKRAMGGVLFIDEAYFLYRPENERDYGQEAIEILLSVMENERDDLVVILAGYGDRMGRFFASNPGMRSRIAHHVEFPDYTPDELFAFLDTLITENRAYLAGDANAMKANWAQVFLTLGRRAGMSACACTRGRSTFRTSSSRVRSRSASTSSGPAAAR